MSTVLVTGGSRGIGRAVCLAFAKAGYDVAFCYSKDRAGAEQTCRMIESAGAGAQPFLCDVSDESAVREMFSSVYGLEVLVNNAGRAHLRRYRIRLYLHGTKSFPSTRAALFCARAKRCPSF